MVLTASPAWSEKPAPLANVRPEVAKPPLERIIIGVPEIVTE
jgi:hypothetical protein